MRHNPIRRRRRRRLQQQQLSSQSFFVFVLYFIITTFMRFGSLRTVPFTSTATFVSSFRIIISSSSSSKISLRTVRSFGRIPFYLQQRPLQLQKQQHCCCSSSTLRTTTTAAPAATSNLHSSTSSRINNVLFHRRMVHSTSTTAMSSQTSSSSSSNLYDDEVTATTATNGGVQQQYGVDMDQNTLMETDMLIAVNEKDVCIPNTILSKKQGHIFNVETPRAVLHRAFSFFIFNEKNELLLTQRASSKITFPNVWTNTVCSHPLVGMKPNEVDDTVNDYPTYPGIKYAAIRKCYHELGIPYDTIDINQIQFITKFHYWAADTITYGNTNSCPWGEHEIDYILFYQLSDSSSMSSDQFLSLIQANPEEVSDYKFVSIDELKAMYTDKSLLWSPWFRGIMEYGGFLWWEQLQDTIQQQKFTNQKITYFDPPSIHYAPYNHNPQHNPLTGVLSIPEQEQQQEE